MGTLDTAYDIVTDGSYGYIADGAGGLQIASLECGSLEEVSNNLPTRLTLAQPRLTPNPAWGAVRVDFELPRSGDVRLCITDPAGRHVRSLLRGNLGQGNRTVSWDGRNDHGRPVASGVYLVRVETQGQSRTGRVTVLR
jgi:hypothetical protein